ncbi:hypothetical protein WMY93_030862 [Mugilogobius chulae]|uniref:Uncharacterized protein n=1 Tax=Mugilogobius chulae TaxID=88201 RepID=A0AAW0MK24_9GOBI
MRQDDARVSSSVVHLWTKDNSPQRSDPHYDLLLLSESIGKKIGKEGEMEGERRCEWGKTHIRDLGLGYVLRQVGSGPVTLAHRAHGNNPHSPWYEVEFCVRYLAPNSWSLA